MSIELRILTLLITFVYLFEKSYSQESLVCKDDFGNDVDWFFTYKLPKDHNSQDSGYLQGSTYFFIASNSASNSTWKKSSKSILDTDSIVAQTISKIYSGGDETGYVLYNDQPPDREAKGTGGHTKGVIIFNSQKGVWIQHSVPHFPKTPNSESEEIYPETGLKNGQIFLCLSLTLPQIEIIGEELEYTRPDVYDFNISPTLSSLLPKITQVAKFNATKKTGPWFAKLPLSVGSLDFTIYAKGPKFRKEIYGEWIAEDLESSLNVQSWLNGPRPIPTECIGPYSTNNILEKEIQAESFSNAVDHSKWAIGTDEKSPIVCIGDLNRMESQKARGGGAVCVINSAIWKVFTKSVTAVEPCPKQ